LGAIDPDLCMKLVGGAVDYTLEPCFIEHLPIIRKKWDLEFFSEAPALWIYITECNQTAIGDVFGPFYVFG
jgi:hypothetical protein